MSLGALNQTDLSVVDAGNITAPLSRTTSILQDEKKDWAPNILQNMLVRIVNVHGKVQVRVIENNSADSIAVKSPWLFDVQTGARYEVILPSIKDTINSLFAKNTSQVLSLAGIAAGATSTLAQCSPIALTKGFMLIAITVTCTFNAAATLGARVHVRTSVDNTVYDTVDWDVWDMDFAAGQLVRQTMNYQGDPMYLKVLVENLDAAQALTNLSVSAVKGLGLNV